MFRSKVQWYEEGEKNSKYFYALEKARYNAKTCYKIIDNKQNEIVNPIEILNVQRDFYKLLYSSDDEVNFTLENSHNIFVPENIRLNQNIPLEERDLEQAIKLMANNKTPGQDGIPVDFYKVFWSRIRNVFCDMVNACFEDEQLHNSAKKGILNLIPKPGKDTRFVKNLRPITLLNTDYKIIEKAVANKMIPALEHIIHSDQRGFMKERRISVNIRKMLDIIHYANQEDLEAVVLSLDFVKCFDKCSFSILHGSLEYFQFGEVVKKWTKILYDNFTVEIQNNGFFSETIDIKKGVHQGGCCSSVYFLVIAEILALALRSNEEIDGINIQQIKNLLNQFADDMDVFSMCNEKSISAIYEELGKFRLQSGFTVSYDKTTLYRIGSLRHSDAQLYGMSQFVWSNNDINVLGVKIAHEDILQKNYDPIIQKSRETLNAWYNRGLSLIGKIQVVNTLVASLYVHKMMVLPFIPSKTIKSIDNIIREFLWNGKKAKIAYSILQNPKDQGGLNLVNLRKKEQSLKATWPVILSKEGEYAEVVYAAMRCNGIKSDIWRCSLCEEHVDKMRIKNTFWVDVLKSWCSFNFMYDHRIENQIIWYNSNILVADTPIMWNDNYQKGLKYVYQLFENQQYKTDDQVWVEFGLTKLRFNSLKKCIPQQWKDFFMTYNRQQYLPLPPNTYDQCLVFRQKGLASRVYKYINGDFSLLQNKYVKWSQELGVDICEDIVKFGQLHKEIYRITNVAKYRSFQYRILQRGLVTNIQLKKWKIKDSDQCYFCQEYKESIVHLLYECKHVQGIWLKLEKYVKEKFGLGIKLSAKNVIKNEIVHVKGHVINFMCLITKQYIYRVRCMQQQLNFPILQNSILSIESMEKYIAVKNGKLNKHLKKWCKCSNTSGNESILDYVTEYIDEQVQIVT